jgi:D-alanyl-lipoteichoic acid acyltransferase DltB (MBOAT superfamily)
MITMALGGLWHGAGWTFVVWGVLHGVGLAAGVLWRRWFVPIPWLVGWAMLMGFLVVSWVFFRAPSLAAACNVLTAMAAGAGPAPRGPGTIAIAAAVVFLAPTSQSIVAKLRPYRWLAPAGAFATLALLLKLADGPAYEFIYFHF